MKSKTLPRYVYEFSDRHGRRRRYFRRNKHNVPLLAGQDTESPAFKKAYQKALDDSWGPVADRSSKVVPGSFAALCHAYESSAGFKQFAATTRREMGYMIKRLVKAHGSRRIMDFATTDLLEWQDELAERPGTANNMLRTMKQLMAFAVLRRYRPDNPAAGLKELKGGEHRPWTEEELALFEARYPVGSRERRAYALALYTGQRKSDLIAMTRAKRSNGLIKVKQLKTGEDLEIREHPELTRALDTNSRSSLFLIAREDGRPMSANHFGSWFSDAIGAVKDEAGNKLLEGCVLHGLRKSAGTRLAEAGCTAHEIMAVLGHKTLAMVMHYTKKADQRRNASAAILKLEQVCKDPPKPLKSNNP